MKGTRKNRICVEKICFYCEEIEKILENHGAARIISLILSKCNTPAACALCR